jgi:nucleotide-binding universal stress UspA family protein
MSETDDYCELCDLPRSQCIHGRPPPPAPVKAAPAAPKPRKRPATKVSTPARPPQAAPRRWTPPEAFKPLILSVLEQAGGELEAEQLFAELEALVGDQLRPADSETTPEGEPRWQYAARRARVTLIAEGRMTKSRPGVWQLAR